MSKNLPRIILAILIVYIGAEIAPKLTNALLILILVGVLLSRVPQFAGLFQSIANIGK